MQHASGDMTMLAPSAWLRLPLLRVEDLASRSSRSESSLGAEPAPTPLLDAMFFFCQKQDIPSFGAVLWLAWRRQWCSAIKTNGVNVHR